MAKTREQVLRMDLDDFHRYLDEKRRELEACYGEIEEIQMQFNDIFKQALAAWQERFTFCFPRLIAERETLPPAFAEVINQAEAEEKARLQQEMADLEREISEGRGRMDALMAQGQDTTERLRTMNPLVNKREEMLKADMVRLQDEYARAYEEIEKLDASPLGWVTHAGQISRYRKVQRNAKQEQARVLQKLREVRQEWLERVQKVGETQAELRDEWQQASIKVSQAQTRLEHLRNNFDTLAEQTAVQHVLEGLKEPPDVPGELGEALRDLVERNKVRWNYEEGLRAVAEALGLSKGVGEGLTRFQQSVRTVVQEQRRYNLKRVNVEVPQFVVELNETWKGLRDKVRDEKYLGTHPLEFSRIVDQYIKERLTDQNIQALFDRMGQALNRATDAWK